MIGTSVSNICTHLPLFSKRICIVDNGPATAVKLGSSVIVAQGFGADDDEIGDMLGIELVEGSNSDLLAIVKAIVKAILGRAVCVHDHVILAIVLRYRGVFNSIDPIMLMPLNLENAAANLDGEFWYGQECASYQSHWKLLDCKPKRAHTLREGQTCRRASVGLGIIRVVGRVLNLAVIPAPNSIGNTA
jgi:hypothetical protein